MSKERNKCREEGDEGRKPVDALIQGEKRSCHMGSDRGREGGGEEDSGMQARNARE